jgi:uncharacterized membrane protein SpoIIM required for sporulation
MLEMLINPRKAERRSWEMFFVGLFYASLSILLVNWIFAQDAVLAKYSGILIVTFTVMFSLPFMYFTLKNEESKGMRETGFMNLLKGHSKAILALMFLFIGFVVAFSFWYIVLSSSQNFRAQIETYCMINRPGNFDDCVSQYGVKNYGVTGFASNKSKIAGIFANNVYVLMFTLLFSIIFGAGAIFVLAWNASVIAAAVGIYTRSNLTELPLGIARYMTHGVFEIGAYFIGAVAGGIISMAIIGHETKSEKFWSILQDCLNLIIIAVVVLFIAAIIEVFVTPSLF